LRWGTAGALPDRLSATVYPAAGCGLRLGETLALELAHVNFLRREITVVQQLKVVAGRRPSSSTPRSTRQRRPWRR